jgi:hypothetical protein
MQSLIDGKGVLNMARRRKKRARPPRPIVMTREAASAMFACDRHHGTDPRSQASTVDALLSGDLPFRGRSIRGRIIA